MAKHDTWTSTSDSMSPTGIATKTRNGKKWAVLAGGIALAGAGLALTKGRKPRKAKRK
ncbi:MAG: hypothetical protein H0T78_05450 [Longispora sp.]|nr:hypothetical protein [Longispora sp. (in: high G+C Gram-positive bacteria)]